MTSCKKEPISKEPSNVVSTTDTNASECPSPTLLAQKPILSSICINPNDPDMFIYLRDGSLHKYTISNGSDVKVGNIQPFGVPQWGPEGWILYSDFDIHRIKEDGSEVEQLTHRANEDYSYEFPYWSPDGSKYIYSRVSHFSNDQYTQNPELRKRKRMLIADATTNDVVDSTCIPQGDGCMTWGVSAWEDNQTISLAAYDDGFTNVNLLRYKIDYHTTEELSFLHSKNDLHYLSHTQAPGGRYIFYTLLQTGLFRYDLTTGETKQLRTSPGEGNYSDLAISSDGRSLFAVKEVRTKLDYCTKVLEWFVVKMDVEGQNETIINIPK